MPFQPTDEITLRLTVTEWNQIIAQLHEGTYKVMAPLINKINVQAAQHEKASQEQAAFANGEVKSDIGPVPGATIARGDLN
jgi:hypothetical protein